MIYLNENIKEQLAQDAFCTFPDECCGFLLGVEKQDERIIEQIIVVNNVKEGDKRRRFEISPLDYIKAEQYAEQKKLTLLGVYHSHPNHPSIPSEHDRVSAQPFFSYVILSVKDEELISIQSWRLNDDFQFQEEKLIILNNKQSNLNNNYYGNNHYSHTVTEVH